MIKKFSFLAPIALTGILLTSCGGEQHQAEDPGQVTTDTLSVDVRAKMDVIRVGIPSPLFVSKHIIDAGINFDKGLLNPSSKASGYSAKYQAALNLGVYGADFGYVAGFNQSQDVLEYMAQVAKLAKTLGIEAAFNEEFGKELNDNLGKGDTLVNVIDRAYMKAEKNLRSNDRVAIAALVIAGGWVEAMHLTASAASADKPKDKMADLYKELFNYAFAYTYVTDMLKLYEKDADCAKMLQELKSIEPIMLSAGKNPRIGAEDAKKLKEAIGSMRNKII